jgi:glycosyltransferase involved in cell wall biosynthesis
MRVLILSSKLPYPAIDGGAIATLNLATGLANNGIDVSLLSFNTKKHFYPPEKIPASLCSSIDIHTINLDTAIRPIKAIFNYIFSTKPYIAKRFYNKAFKRKLIDLLSENKFDFVQLEGPYFDFYIPFIRKYSDAKISLRAHNIEHEIWQRRNMKESKFLIKIYITNLSKRIQKLEKALLHEIDLLIPISQRDGEKLKELNPLLEQITVPTGIDLMRYPSNNSESNRNIFFIGALDWAPNQEGLLWFINEVIPHLEKADDPVTVHIAGRNAPKDFIPKINHRLIKYYGEVADAKLFMSNFGVMAVPLLSGSGIRIKILEGMALGKCIVSTEIGIEGIPALDRKHLLLANEGKEFAESLLKILDNKELATSLSFEARKFIGEEFDSTVVARKLVEYYKKIA